MTNKSSKENMGKWNTPPSEKKFVVNVEVVKKLKKDKENIL
jgi:hypothetical protein